MNILLFLNKDIEANLAFNLLKPELSEHNIKIYYSESVGSIGDKPPELEKLEFYEKDFFYEVVSEMISKSGSKFVLIEESNPTFHFEKCTNPNSEEFIQEVIAFKPDLFISIRFGKIFKEGIIQIPKMGIINLHSTILPNYRGVLGTLHAIRQGDTIIGCTLHTIPNSQIDTGEIIGVAKIDVDPSRSLFWNIIQLYPIGIDLIKSVLRKLKKGIDVDSIPQTQDEGNYYTLPTKEDFEQLKNIGMEVISPEDYLDVLKKFVFESDADPEYG